MRCLVTRTRSLFVLTFIAAALAACDSAHESQVVGPQSDLIVINPTVVTTTEPVETNTVVAVVGKEGGQITNGEHALSIPRRAVLTPTEFTFTVVGGTNIRVDLTAKAVSTGLPVTTFASSLTLKLSYRNAAVSDPSSLIIAWLVENSVDGLMQPVPSYVDKYNQFVLGSLSHFSEYVIAD